MKKIILISPFAKKMRDRLPNGNEKINPKNYPFWDDVVRVLQKKNYHVIQIGVKGESAIGADEIKHNLSLQELQKLLNSCDSWIAVDTFFQHFATYYGKKGVVIFSKSDPNIFGYDQNINLLKDRKNLRPDQFGLWESVDFNINDFVEPNAVIDAVEKLLL